MAEFQAVRMASNSNAIKVPTAYLKYRLCAQGLHSRWELASWADPEEGHINHSTKYTLMPTYYGSVMCHLHIEGSNAIDKIQNRIITIIVAFIVNYLHNHFEMMIITVIYKPINFFSPGTPVPI